MVAGSTGESPTLTHKEKAELFRAVGDAIRGRGKLICGVGTYSTAETLELTQAAEDADADGLLVVTPYYNKPPQRGLDRALRARGRRHRAADHRVQHPRPDGDADRARRPCCTLAEKPNIVAVKDSTGDFQGISRLIAEAPEGFEVYSGDDWATFGYVCLGAVGVVSVAAHLVGPQIRQMIDLIETGDVPAARKVHEGSAPLFNALFVTSNPIPLKAALEMVGPPGGTAAPAARSGDRGGTRPCPQGPGGRRSPLTRPPPRS